MPTIRHATPEDASAIAAIWNPWIADTAVTFSKVERSPEAVRGLMAQRAERGWPWLVATDDAGGLTGFATYAQFRPGAGYAHTMEHTIILSQDGGGKGVGRALIQALVAEARAKGVHVLVGCVSGENAEAIAFHARLGFREAGRITQAGRKFDRWMDLALFELVL
jgi:L-amino acid N-acyltransferase YncA